MTSKQHTNSRGACHGCGIALPFHDFCTAMLRLVAAYQDVGQIGGHEEFEHAVLGLVVRWGGCEAGVQRNGYAGLLASVSEVCEEEMGKGS